MAFRAAREPLAGEAGRSARDRGEVIDDELALRYAKGDVWLPPP